MSRRTLSSVSTMLFLAFVLLASLAVKTQAQALSPTRTRTPTKTVGASPTRTSIPTSTPTFTPPPAVTNTPTPFGVCGPVMANINAPFTFDGAGIFCWRSTNIGSYVYATGVDSLLINGIECKYGCYPWPPPSINGYWYIVYKASAAWAHIEFK